MHPTIHQLTYDVTPDALDEYLQMDDHCTRDCLDFFTVCVIQLFMPEYLRKPDLNDIQKLYNVHNNIHEFSGMLGSINLGANNDLTISNNSLLFDELLDDIAPVAPFEVNGVTFEKRASVSACLGKFKRSVAPKTGGSILCLLEELVKVGRTMGYNMEGYMNKMTEIIESQGAARDSRDKRMLWDYLTHVSSQWDGEVVMMGDFDEVRFKSDRFLISDGLMNTCPNINAITLERYLSDHRSILFRESTYDYGPIPFRFYHHWLALDGFDNFVIDSWRNTPGDKSNAMRNLMYKLKFLKVRIRGWLSTNKNSTKAEITSLIGELAKLDEVIDNGNTTDDTVLRGLEVLNSIQNLNQIQATEAAQKAKIKWSVEGDENVRFFHGMINKKRSQQNIQGVMIDGKWIEEPSRVKEQFFQYFRDRFDEPKDDRVRIDMCFPRSLSNEQKDDLERMVSMEEVKRAVWDCGTDKSSGPDGFSFGFYRHFWPTIDNEVFEAVKYFFIYNNFPIGCDIVNEVKSAFIAERQILDGPFILNEVMHWCKTKKKQALFFRVDFEKAYDTVRWDFLEDVLHKFGFGNRASCLKMNMSKSKIMGVHVEAVKVKQEASKLGCLILKTHFSYLGTKVEGSMSRVHAWDEVVEKVTSRLSRWKMNTLSIGGRLTLLKSVLGSIPIFHMLIFKVPSSVLQRLESIWSRFFKGHDLGSNKASWVKWSNVLTPKEKGEILFMGKSHKGDHGEDGKIGKAINFGASSCWTSIVREVEVLKQQGVNFFEYLQLNMGNGESTTFWEDRWLEGSVLKDIFPRLYVLETNKKVSVGDKLKDFRLDSSFRQKARGGIEQVQYEELSDMVNSISLIPKNDRYVWCLYNSGDFSVASFRKVIDENRYPGGTSRTR
nr:RNA-directed DNA polymerase, eukaryota, reverse transcriptase zinc-binding domain protein [Tanacetum cinerariifolium]